MSIPAERLREGQNILVRGKISFSRLAAHINGAELERSIANAIKRGSLYPTKKPHTTISLIDAHVVPLDANNPTIEEQFVAEKIYVTKTGDNAGKRGFSIDDTSPNLPQVFAPSGHGTHKQIVLEGDLDSGLDVVLVLRTFKSGDYAKRGLGLSQVFLQEDLRYYQSSGIDKNALAALGITVEGPIRRIAASEGVHVENQQETDEVAMPSLVVQPEQAPQAGPAQSYAGDPSGFSMPTPQAAPAPAPVQDDQAAKLAALHAQLAALKAGQQAQAPVAPAAEPTPQGGSPFDAGDSPWGQAQPGIGFGG